MKKKIFFCEKEIPFLKECFKGWGEWIEFTSIPGLIESINQGEVSGVEEAAEVFFFIKTSTRCDASWDELGDLLPKIRGVGTAAVGSDHIDFPYLKKNGIEFFHTPGCNRNAVGDYVFFLILRYCLSRRKSLHALTVAIVGLGNIGYRLAMILKDIGVRVIAYDPFIDFREEKFRSLFHTPYPITLCNRWEELLSQSQMDVLTLHVPLTRTGPYPTYHLIDEQALGMITAPSGRVPLLINSSRGGVVSEEAMLPYVGRSRDQDGRIDYATDVWEGEPNIHARLASRCFFATPHIAGYTFSAKKRAAQWLYRKVTDYIVGGREEGPAGDTSHTDREMIATKTMELGRNHSTSPEACLYQIFNQVTGLDGIAEDFLRRSDNFSSEELPWVFQEMRKTSLREEVSDYRFRLVDEGFADPQAGTSKTAEEVSTEEALKVLKILEAYRLYRL